jgi:UDP-N-acetyl-2-amino-2-deoxyglucuronate dehydrogenase
VLAAVDPHDRLEFPIVSPKPISSPVMSFSIVIWQNDSWTEDERVHYVSICSPNALHDAHIRSALWAGADAICEKPLVIMPWNLDELALMEEKLGQRVYTILQLRLHPALIALKQKLESQQKQGRHVDVQLTYITRRGHWYFYSWKGNPEQSGTLAMNIGIHFFDLLIWFFGSVQESHVYLAQRDRMAGMLDLEHARVNWFLSINGSDLPETVRQAEKFAFRSIKIEGEEVEFTDGFTDLHTRVYEDILAGGGFGIEDARPSIELVHRLRTSDLVSAPPTAHPFLRSLGT